MKSQILIAVVVFGCLVGGMAWVDGRLGVKTSVAESGSSEVAPESFEEFVGDRAKAAADGDKVSGLFMKLFDSLGSDSDEMPISNDDMLYLLLDGAEDGDASQQLAVGFAYDNKGDYAEALKWYTLAGENGNELAQLRLGAMYFDGTGVEKDIQLAIDWFKLSGEQGNVDAQSMLGAIYYNGLGVDVDYNEAFKWVEPAAEHGNLEMQKILGFMYYDGNGVEQDYSLAVKWLSNPAQINDDPQLCVIVGGIYSNNLEGVEQDFVEAYKWLNKAVDKDNADAQLMVGSLYLFGWGVEKDYYKAKELLVKAAEQNIKGAFYYLGFIYETGKGVNLDKGKALEWYRKAEDMGVEEARYKINHILSATNSN